jgi:hypothetical protein
MMEAETVTETSDCYLVSTRPVAWKVPIRFSYGEDFRLHISLLLGYLTTLFQLHTKTGNAFVITAGNSAETRIGRDR